MGVPLLRDAFDVLRATPLAPALPLRGVEDRIEAWHRHTARWIVEIPAASARHLAEGGTAAEIVADLEGLRDEVQDRLVVLRDLAAEARSGRLHDLLTIEAEAGSRFLNFLTCFLADIDPEARGGPSFDDADDLMAYLNR